MQYREVAADHGLIASWAMIDVRGPFWLHVSAAVCKLAGLHRTDRVAYRVGDAASLSLQVFLYVFGGLQWLLLDVAYACVYL